MQLSGDLSLGPLEDVTEEMELGPNGCGPLGTTALKLQVLRERLNDVLEVGFNGCGPMEAVVAECLALPAWLSREVAPAKMEVDALWLLRVSDRSVPLCRLLLRLL